MFFTSLCNDSRNRQTFTSSSPTSTETEVLFFLLNRPKRILLFPCQLVKKTFLNVRMFFTSLCNDSKNKKHLPAQSQQQKHWKELSNMFKINNISHQNNVIDVFQFAGKTFMILYRHSEVMCKIICINFSNLRNT